MSIKDLLHMLRKRFIMIIIIPVVLTGAISYYTYNFVPKKYMSTAKIMVGQIDTSGTQVSAQDYVLWQEIAVEGAEVIRSSSFLARVSERLNGIPVHRSYVAVDMKTASERQLEIFVNTEDYNLSSDIANAVVDEFKMYCLDRYQKDYVEVLEEAKPELVPVSPKIRESAIFSFTGGLIFSIGLAILLEIMDLTLKSNEDIEKNLNVPVLSRIPKYY